MHFYMHSNLHKKFYSYKKWVLQWLSVKKNLRSGLKSVLRSHIWTLGRNNFLAPNLMEICIHVDHAIRKNFSFESRD
jgi:hypothetical protein